ncbi:MAG: energy-dependent translational throttle protein EttA [Proteobacteria bacterium]|nr:energy-dependent translational throttle protein EttA [Pseudomonadota bacterium]
MAAPQYVYVMHGLSKTYPGGKPVLRDITLSFLPGAKIAIIGENGSGKSTLMKIMAGLDTEFSGEAWAADGIKVGYLPQEPELEPTRNVLENVMEGMREAKALITEFEEISMKFAEEMPDQEMAAVMERQGELQEQIDAIDAWDLESRAEVAMDALRCPSGETDVSTLSGGEVRRVALCRLLLEKPDILLLDEPTNHLDAESVAWLQHYLQKYQGTVILVTHDRYFLDNVVGWVLELDRGQGIPWQGNYSNWLEQKQKRLNLENKAEASHQRALQRELEWIRSSPRARQAKGKARINAYEELLAQSQEVRRGTMRIMIQPAGRLGDNVIEADHLTKGFGDLLLIEDLSFRLPPGGIVGVIGPNGAGKTTLFKMLMGSETPDKGALKVGESVKLAYVDQSRAALNDGKTVWQEISGGDDILYFGKNSFNSRAYTSFFGFKGPDQQKKVGQLSGGERNRVHLAKVLKEGGNVLLLDEPTNDLDVETLRALEDALLEFAGCAVIISHDRFFLDRIATHILAFEGDSHVEWFEGNFEAYEEDKKRRLGIGAGQPHRIKFKKFER